MTSTQTTAKPELELAPKSADTRSGLSADLLEPLFRGTGLLGKDLWRYFPLPVLISLISVVPFVWQRLLGFPLSWVAGVFLTSAAVSAFCIGIALTGEEEDSGTRRFMDQLPAKTLRHGWTKLLSGVLLVLLWAVCQSLLLASLTAFPSGLVRTIVDYLYDSYQARHTLLDADRMVALFLVLLPIAQLLTGLASGALIPNLTLSVIVGVALEWMSMLAWFLVAEKCLKLNTNGDGAKLVTFLSMWSILCLGAYLWAYSKPRQPRASLIERLRPYVTVELSLFHRSRSGSQLVFPEQKMLRSPLRTLAACALLSLPMFVWRIRGSEIFHDCTMMSALFLVAAACILGSSLWSNAERDGVRFQGFSLPQRPDQMLAQRVKALLVADLWFIAWMVVALLAAFGLGWYMGKLDPSFLRAEQVGKSLRIILPVSLDIVMAYFSLSLLVSFFTLLVRMKLIAMVLGVVVTGFWCVAGGRRPDTTLASAAYLVWAEVVSLGLPLLLLFVGYCRSPLLELSEKRRGMVAAATCALLIFWGSFLLGLSPADLVKMAANL